MAVQSRALGMAAGLVVGAAFALCALAVAVAPGPVMTFFGWVFHADMSAMAGRVTVASFVGGVLLLGAYVGLIAGLTATLYNRMTRRSRGNVRTA